METELQSNQREEQSSQKRFIQMATVVVRYAKEIKPTLSANSDLMIFLNSIEPAEVSPENRDDAIAEAVARIPRTAENEKLLHKVLECFETKAYVYEKTADEHIPEAKRVILSSSHPLAFNAMLPLLKRLKADPRCSGIMFLVDNVSAKRFEEDGSLGFSDVRAPHDQGHKKGILEDILAVAKEEGRFDIAVAPADGGNSAQSLILHASKDALGAKHLYYVDSGWNGITADDLLRQSLNTESIDGIFCNDHLAALAIERDLPNFPQNNIYETGTPALDGLELGKAETFDHEGRAQLGISNDTLAVLYSGGIQKVFADGYDSRRDIERQTFIDTANAIARAAQAHPERQYALMVRRHPREDQDESKQIYDVSAFKFPKNLRVIPVHNDVWKNGNEVSSIADVCVSLQSTDSFNAHFRGTEGVLLGYQGTGMGAELQQKLYSTLLPNIRAEGTIKVANSPEDFEHWLGERTHKSIRENGSMAKLTDPTGAVLDVMFADTK